jgi:hypothetical protein
VTLNVFQRYRLLGLLASLKLALVLLLIFGTSIAAATFVEARHGTEAARALIYNARWFEILLGLLVLSLILMLIKRWPYRGHQLGFFLIHLAMIVILVAAGITRFFGYEGLMPIREGQTTNIIYSSEDHLQLTVAGRTLSAPVRLWKPGANSLARRLHFGDGVYRLRVRDYWPHYEERLVAGEGGVPAIRFATVGGQGMDSHSLVLGESLWLGEMRVRFAEDALPEDLGGGRYGALMIHLEGQTHNLAVPAQPPADLSAAGYRFVISEFQPDYKVGAAPDLSRPMNNPMIRVSITGPDGRQGERILFAYHPEFSMSHGGREDPFAGLDMLYRFERGLVFAREEDGLTARCSLPLQEMDMATAEVSREIPVGTSFRVEEMTLYRDPDGSFSLVLQEYLPSAVRRGVPSEDAHAPAAARVEVRSPSGALAEALVLRGEPGTEIELDGHPATVALGPVQIQLPYSLELEDFVLQTYPGSNNPASYESHVLLFDPAKGIDGKPVRIYMNHPLTHRGFKHFQSSYDSDRLGTILSVNYDPGKWPTYAGYVLITLGFILVLAKGLIWPRRRIAQGRSPE